DAAGPPEWATEHHPDLQALLAAIASGGAVPAVVCAAAPAAAPAGEDPTSTTRAGLYQTLELLQAWLEHEALTGTRLVLLAQEISTPHDAAIPDLGAAAMVGLLRSAASEHPGRF